MTPLGDVGASYPNMTRTVDMLEGVPLLYFISTHPYCPIRDGRKFRSIQACVVRGFYAQENPTC